MNRVAGIAFFLSVAITSVSGEVCTTQSQMQPAVRDSIAQTARSLADKVQANDADGLKAQSIPQIAKDFTGVTGILNSTSAKIKGAPLVVDSVWFLDASSLKPNEDGSNATGQFFCSLNNSAAATDFSINGLPAGKYAFAIVKANSGTAAWTISLLLRDENGIWKMAGLYPKSSTAAGKDGLYYWTTARALARQNQQWNAWFYYQQAAELLQPVSFLSSSHLEKLLTETSSAAPPALSKGLSEDLPYVLRSPDGTEYRITRFGYDDSSSKEKIDLVLHLKAENTSDAVATRKRNTEAARAMVVAHPELRQAFHGIWVSSEASGSAPFATEESMDNLH